jgi:hypothetical protein
MDGIVKHMAQSDLQNPAHRRLSVPAKPLGPESKPLRRRPAAHIVPHRNYRPL